MMIITLLLLTSCAPVTVPLPPHGEGYEIADEVPLAYEADLALWAGSYDAGCTDGLLLTARCHEGGQVPPEALLWLLGPDWCRVAVEAPPDAGPCAATIWAPVTGDTGI